MIYSFLKPFMVFGYMLFYRKIFLVNYKNVPRNKPVLLASNHPNAFLDAIALGILFEKGVYSLARGDVFNKGKILDFLLYSVKILPIYRKRDLKTNENSSELNNKTFDACYKLFKKNQIVLIFSEGLCVWEKRLRPLKKGTARMALEAKFEKGIDLQIFTSGLNYTKSNKIREDLMIQIGDVIDLNKYKNIYQENTAKAVNILTKEIQEELKKQVIHIENPENEALIEQLFVIYRNNLNESVLPWISSNHKRFQLENSLVKSINQLQIDNENQVEELKNICQKYFKNLKSNRLTDKALAEQKGFPFFKTFLFVLFFPVFLIGYLTHLPSLIIGKFAVKKMVKEVEFESSIGFGVGYFSLLIFYILFSFIGFLFFGKIGWILLIIIPLAGYFSFIYKDLFFDFRKQWRNYFIKKKYAIIIKDLLLQRIEIQEKFNFQPAK